MSQLPEGVVGPEQGIRVMDEEEDGEVQQAPGPTVDDDMADIAAQEYSSSFIPRPVATALDADLLIDEAEDFAGRLGGDSDDENSGEEDNADEDVNDPDYIPDADSNMAEADTDDVTDSMRDLDAQLSQCVSDGDLDAQLSQLDRDDQKADQFATRESLRDAVQKARTDADTDTTEADKAALFSDSVKHLAIL